MANIDPAPQWADIRQLETTDRNMAGAGGVLNTQAVSTAARLNLLRENATALNNTVSGVSSRQDAADSAIASLESQVLDAPGTLTDVDSGAPIVVSDDSLPAVLSVENSRGPILAINESLADLMARDIQLDKNKLETSQANPRTIDFLHRQGFVSGQVSGPYGPDLTTVANLPFTVVDGALSVAPAGSSSFIRVFGIGQRRFSDGPLRASVSVTMDAMTAGTYGPFIGFGDSQSSFRGIWFSSAGVLSVVDSAAAVVGGQSRTDANTSFIAGQPANLELEVMPDGTGWAIATNNAGNTIRLNFTGIPLGNVWAVWRRAALGDSGKITKFYIQHKASTSPLKTINEVNSVGASFANGFLAENVDGIYTGVGGTLSSNRWKIVSGKLQMVVSAAGVFLAKIGMTRTDFSSMEYEAVATITAGQGGSCIAIGDDPATRMVFSYLTNGFVGVLNSANAVVSGAVQAGMTYTIGQKVRVRVVARADNTGSVTAVSPTGQTATIQVSGIPTGTVWAVQRNAGTVEIDRITNVPIAGSLADIGAAVASMDLISNDWQSFKLLPDATPGRAVPGWTPTGLDMIPKGGMAGFMISGDDGRILEGDGSLNQPAMHITDPEFSRIVMTIPGGYTGASLQGVACDTLAAATATTVWAACSTNGTIRNYALYGASAATEISSDRITMSDLGVSGFNPNALAFDASRGTGGRGALWVGSNTGTTVYCIDANPAASTKILSTITLANNADHFQIIDGKLFYQYGDNGTRANIRVYDLSTNTESAKWGPFQDALAPEGFYYHKASKTLYMNNDGGYHASVGNLKFNVVIKYKVSAP